MCAQEHPCCGQRGSDCGCASILSGLLRPCLLLLIAEGAGRHGYELSAALSELGLDVSADGGRLYRALRHLEREGLVESAWEGQSAGPARRVYTTTADGRAYLREVLSAVAGATTSLSRIADRISRLE